MYKQCNIILLLIVGGLILLSVGVNGQNNQNKGSLRAYNMYSDIHGHKEYLKAVIAKYKASQLSYEDYPVYEHSRDSLLMKYGHCSDLVEWLNKGDLVMDLLMQTPQVRLDEKHSQLINGYIYPFIWTKEVELTKSCL